MRWRIVIVAISNEGRHQLELEADAFAGPAMKLLGRRLESSPARGPICPRWPSGSLTQREARIQAITRGWNDPAFRNARG